MFGGNVIMVIFDIKKNSEITNMPARNYLLPNYSLKRNKIDYLKASI